MIYMHHHFHIMIYTIRDIMIFAIGVFWYADTSYGVFYYVLQRDTIPLKFEKLSQHIRERTSIEISDTAYHYHDLKQGFHRFFHPWIFTHNWKISFAQTSHADPLLRWLLRGGVLYAESSLSTKELQQQISSISALQKHSGIWRNVPADHPVMKSFYLLESLPTCQGVEWKELHHQDRMLILAAPPGFLNTVSDTPQNNKLCLHNSHPEVFTKVMVNVIMVFLTMDYKNDLVHLPEILKRIR